MLGPRRPLTKMERMMAWRSHGGILTHGNLKHTLKPVKPRLFWSWLLPWFARSCRIWPAWSSCPGCCWCKNKLWGSWWVLHPPWRETPDWAQVHSPLDRAPSRSSYHLTLPHTWWRFVRLHHIHNILLKNTELEINPMCTHPRCMCTWFYVKPLTLEYYMSVLRSYIYTLILCADSDSHHVFLRSTDYIPLTVTSSEGLCDLQEENICRCRDLTIYVNKRLSEFFFFFNKFKMLLRYKEWLTFRKPAVY